MFGLDMFSGTSGLLSTAEDVWKVGRASDEASFARDWSKQMSDTTYQRTVADMRAAGLNPILAAGGMSTVPMPSAAVASVPSGVSNPFSSALETKQLMAQIDLLQNQSEKTWQEGKAARADAYTKSLLFDVMNNNKDGLIDKMMSEISTAKSVAASAGYNLAEAKSSSEFWQKFGEGGKEAGVALPFLMNLLKQFTPKSGGITINK